MNSEIVILIVGALLGATLTFTFNRLEKRLEKNKEKQLAFLCLRIELKRISSYLKALSNTQTSLGFFTIPSTDIPELELITQANQFMYLNEKLADKIYNLTTCLRSANKHRQNAFILINQQSNPEFISNAEIFKYEVDDANQILRKLDDLVQFSK